jgi:hypothetical protein
VSMFWYQTKEHSEAVVREIQGFLHLSPTSWIQISEIGRLWITAPTTAVNLFCRPSSIPKVFPILPDNIKYGLRGFFMEIWLAKSIFIGTVILAAVVNFRIALNLIRRKFKWY